MNLGGYQVLILDSALNVKAVSQFCVVHLILSLKDQVITQTPGMRFLLERPKANRPIPEAGIGRRRSLRARSELSAFKTYLKRAWCVFF